MHVLRVVVLAEGVEVSHMDDAWSISLVLLSDYMK